MTVTREADQIVIRLPIDTNIEILEEFANRIKSKGKTLKGKALKEHTEAIDRLINRDTAKEAREWYEKRKAELNIK